MSGLGADSKGIVHEPQQVDVGHRIEVPASLSARLNVEQLDKLEQYARSHPDARGLRHELAEMEKVSIVGRAGSAGGSCRMAGVGGPDDGSAPRGGLRKHRRPTLARCAVHYAPPLARVFAGHVAGRVV
jgi:hypothetical protein